MANSVQCHGDTPVVLFVLFGTERLEVWRRPLAVQSDSEGHNRSIIVPVPGLSICMGMGISLYSMPQCLHTYKSGSNSSLQLPNHKGSPLYKLEESLSFHTT